MARTWVDEYYNIVEFFYWMPHYLGRSKSEKSRFRNFDEVLPSLRRKEETLNHLLTLLFYLAPNELANDLFSHVFGRLFDEPYRLFDQRLPDMPSLDDVTQPDIFFMGRENVVAIELKINAQSSLEQVIKYAFLFVREQQYAQQEKDRFLLFMGPDQFANLWSEKCPDPNVLQAVLANYPLPDRLGGYDISADQTRIRTMLQQMQIGFINYPQLVDFLQVQRAII